MEYIVQMLLTFIGIWSIIKIVEKSGWKDFDKILYSQSAMHYRLRSIVPSNTAIKEKIPSQVDKHIKENMVKIIVFDGRAYWIDNNIFYVADMENGNVLPDTVQQINTSDMSKEEVDKMLFIVDNLKNGKE